LRPVVVVAPAAGEASDVLGVRARLRHLRGEVEVRKVELVVTNDEPRAEHWFAEVGAGDRIVAEPMWLFATGRTLAGEPIEVTTRVVPLPPPLLFRTVNVVTDAEWGELATVAVDIEGPTGAVRTLSFDAPQQSRTVRIEYSAGQQLTYRYRLTRTFAGGRVERDEWATADASVLLLGAHSAFERIVELTCVGPELPLAGVRLIEVDLSYLDPANQIRHENKLVIKSVNDRPTWRISLADAGLRTVSYRITEHLLSGGQVARPTQKTTERIVPIPIVPRT
jgi:hypothetical protein